MIILGIETSCDETGASVIEAKEKDSKVKLLSNVIASSLSQHAKTGGIIPETAAREQIKYIIPVIKQALIESNLYPPSSIRQLADNLPSSTFYRPPIDAIAVTVGPGLIGSLLVGVETAKTLAYVWNKPIIPVNHLIGHIYANWIKCHPDPEHSEGEGSKIEFPAIALIVSGGHTDLVLMRNHGKIQWLGGTRDDAAGEAFDKIGRLLGLPYPGGPAIEKASERGDASRFTFPKPMIDSKDFDFSFSGLKTAALRTINKCHSELDSESLPEQIVNDLCTSVQQAIIDVLIKKTLKAAQKHKVKSILLGGGVSANQKLRNDLKLKIENFKLKIPFFAPEKWLCTDNAAMIGAAAFFNYKP
ncbi:MAG: tRNA (adenosine(37)-N6)-threonylcarbamoyltransferase complex transferase subunit TsaD, partial [bacterium]|nr:tRNA (adenosine(37)-N6)-threonylcarbamoyltransferase complex transferase subunit TsaD [bacterium]